MMKHMTWIRRKVDIITSALKRGGKDYRRFKKETEEDNYEKSIEKAKQELEEALIEVDRRKKLAREINYKVKNGIELNVDEERFIEIVRL